MASEGFILNPAPSLVSVHASEKPNPVADCHFEGSILFYDYRYPFLEVLGCSHTDPPV